jgi:hypothetical protein
MFLNTRGSVTAIISRLLCPFLRNRTADEGFTPSTHLYFQRTNKAGFDYHLTQMFPPGYLVMTYFTDFKADYWKARRLAQILHQNVLHVVVCQHFRFQRKTTVAGK